MRFCILYEFLNGETFADDLCTVGECIASVDVEFRKLLSQWFSLS